jgi:alpha-glucoside transport system substrate-binding protein
VSRVPSIVPRFVVVGIVVVGVVSGCSRSDGSPGPSGDASGGIGGAHVQVLGLWSGPELRSFETVRSLWEKETGATVDWQGTTDLLSTLADDAKAGHPPEIAMLPNLAMLEQLADDGQLVPLDSVVDMTAVARDYARPWIELGSHDGKLFGLVSKVTSKATVWYDPKAFASAGYAVPTTWDEMLRLADRVVADGRTPFSLASPRGPASGWLLTDLVAVIVLNACGPELYDQWVGGDVPWTDPCIKGSFERFLSIASAKGYALGGKEQIVTTGDDGAADPLFTDLPSAYLSYLPSFAQAFIAGKHPELKAGADYDVFAVPPTRAGEPKAVTVGADVPVVVTDTPGARSFMAFLASARAQEAWIKLGGFTSVNRSVSLDTYPDPVARRVAEELIGADVSRFSAGDMMPSDLQRAWWGAMLELLDDPGKLDAVLEQLTATAKGST